VVTASCLQPEGKHVSAQHKKYAVSTEFNDNDKSPNSLVHSITSHDGVTLLSTLTWYISPQTTQQVSVFQQIRKQI